MRRSGDEGKLLDEVVVLVAVIVVLPVDVQVNLLLARQYLRVSHNELNLMSVAFDVPLSLLLDLLCILDRKLEHRDDLREDYCQVVDALEELIEWGFDDEEILRLCAILRSC